MKKGTVHKRKSSSRSASSSVMVEIQKMSAKLDEMIKLMNLEMEVLTLLKDILTQAEVKDRPVEEIDDESDEDFDG